MYNKLLVSDYAPERFTICPKALDATPITEAIGQTATRVLSDSYMSCLSVLHACSHGVIVVVLFLSLQNKPNDSACKKHAIKGTAWVSYYIYIHTYIWTSLLALYELLNLVFGLFVIVCGWNKEFMESVLICRLMEAFQLKYSIAFLVISCKLWNRMLNLVLGK